MVDFLLELVEEYGYFFFFIALSLGPFGIPVPNEVTVLTAGVLADGGTLNPWYTYLFILGGLATSLTAGYAIGRWIGGAVVPRLRRNQKFDRYWRTADRLTDRYGNIALSLGCFLPVIRYIIPVLAGAKGTAYRRFAAFSYSGAVLWTLAYFVLGVGWGTELTAFVTSMPWNLF